MGGREGEGHGCESAHYLMGVKRRRGQFQFIIYKGSLPHRVEDSADELIGGGRRGVGVVVVARVGGADQQAGPRKHKQHRRRQNGTRKRKGAIETTAMGS